VNLVKISAIAPDGTETPYRYANTYDLQRTTGPLRLIIAPAANHTRLLLDLASCWRGPYGILYVLLTSRTDRRPGRYQSPDTLSRSELAAFLAEHRTFLEADGRHARWIASREGEGTLVYDRHNVVYAYGALEGYETILSQKGFVRAPVRVPVPHAHHFHEENDAAEERMVELWAWRYSPLREGDDD
jgi:hypothetical protein